MTSPPASTSVVQQAFDRNEVLLKLGKWLFFEIVFALVPLLFNWLTGELRNRDGGLDAVLGRGELLLVSVAIVAAALGDLVNRGMNTRLRGTKQTLLGVGCFVICASTWLYSQVAILPGIDSGIPVGKIVAISLIVAPTAMLLSLASSIVAEVR